MKSNLIFHYDNAGHHPELETFPHHKHTIENVIEANEPNLLLILKESKEYLS